MLLGEGDLTRVPAHQRDIGMVLQDYALFLDTTVFDNVAYGLRARKLSETAIKLALPFADTEAMQMHIDEIALHVEKGAHAVLLLDRAGWHTTGRPVWPNNLTPILLPSRSPELRPDRAGLAVLLWIPSGIRLAPESEGT